MILGRELTEDGEVLGPLGVPKPVWSRHVLITGETGSGKTTTATRALTTAHPHTRGPTIVIDPKGTGWLRELARTQYTQTHSLDDVLYFSVPETVPAFSVFDIRRDLSAGIQRPQAVQDLADYFLELIEHVMPDGFNTVRTQDIIRYFIRALFDSVHGHDAWPIQDLLDALYRLKDTGVVPEVSDKTLEQALNNLTQTSARSFEQIIDGAITRVEKIALDSHLQHLFNHVPEEPTDAFTFDTWLDEDVFIFIDISDPSKRIQRVLANLVSAQLWQALRRREKHSRHKNPPIALFCVDELAYLRINKLLMQLLSMGREYGFGMIPMLQFPAQLETDGETSANVGVDPYHEILTNCQTVIAGSITDDPGLVKKLSGSHMTESEVQNRLNNLAPSRWFFKPAATRDIGTVKSHLIAEPPLPPGHPEGPEPLSADQQDAFEESFTECRKAEHVSGVLRNETGNPATTSTISTTIPTPASDAGDILSDHLRANGFLSTLPLVQNLPGKAMYEPAPGTVVCETCGADRPATIDGLLDTIRCHGSLTDVDRSTIPPVELGIRLTVDEIEAAPVSLRLLCALQIIANIGYTRGKSERGYRPCEIDIVHDSPHNVLDLFGIEAADIQTLADEGLITVDKLHRYSYYTVTPAGRDLIRQPHRKGVEWGNKQGDNTESLLHLVMVEALYRYVEQEYVQNPDSPISGIERYYELKESAGEYDLDGETRFDVVGLDANGRIGLIGEAERKNNDAAKAAVRDFDQIATINPDEALWVAPSKKTGHEAVLSPLADPPEDWGGPRVSTYSSGTRLSDITGINEPGLTKIFKLNDIRKQLPEPTLGDGSDG